MGETGGSCRLDCKTITVEPGQEDQQRAELANGEIAYVEKRDVERRGREEGRKEESKSRRSFSKDCGPDGFRE